MKDRVVFKPYGAVCKQTKHADRDVPPSAKLHTAFLDAQFRAIVLETRIRASKAGGQHLFPFPWSYLPSLAIRGSRTKKVRSLDSIRCGVSIFISTASAYYTQRQGKFQRGIHHATKNLDWPEVNGHKAAMTPRAVAARRCIVHSTSVRLRPCYSSHPSRPTSRFLMFQGLPLPPWHSSDSWSVIIMLDPK